MAKVSVMPGAEPWGAEGDNVGVLFVHGFTGSPQSMRYWAEGVAKEGRTVLLPRLPGHGTTPDDMQTTTSADWVREAEMSLEGLKERCDRLFVCGLSMGGTITLDLAARFSDQLAGVVTVNPSLFSTDPRRHLAPLLGKLPLKIKGVSNDIAEPGQQELAYKVVPTKAAASMLAYQERVKQSVPRITCPILLFASRQDHVVNTANSPYALEHVASTDKELVWLERSYHVATLDYDKDLIVERTNAFVKEHSA